METPISDLLTVQQFDSALSAALGRPLDAPKRRNRHRTDPTYRQQAISRAKRWNAQNPAKKLQNDRKWAEKHGAAASKRYRQRKKEQSA